MKAKLWYTMTKPGAAQGIIAEEGTGRTVAVTYDPADAPLAAAAPDLAEALANLERIAHGMGGEHPRYDTLDAATAAARAALVKAGRCGSADELVKERLSQPKQDGPGATCETCEHQGHDKGSYPCEDCIEQVGEVGKDNYRRAGTIGNPCRVDD